MIRTNLTTLAVLLGGAFIAVQLDARQGAGVAAGVILGSSVSALGSLWQRHNFVHRPRRAFASVLETFLFKMVFVLFGALSFRYIEAAASRADWRSFLLAFVAAAFVLQTVSVFENVALLRGTPNHYAGGAPGPQAPSPLVQD